MGTLPSVGLDLASITRFRNVLASDKKHLLRKLFTPIELAYAKRHKDPASHLAGIFAAKEAGSKALGVRKYPYLVLEVRHKEDGAPELWADGKKVPLALSVTHEHGFAAAVAFLI